MPLLKKNQILAAKIETTAGTAESLTAAECVWNAFDVEINYDIPHQARMSQGTLSPLPGVVGPRSGKVSFKVEVHGSGSDGTGPGWATTFLPACAYVTASGGTYAPVSLTSSMSTLTMGVYQSGRFLSIKGAMGNWSLEAEYGKAGVMSFEFTGCYVAPSDVTAITPTYPTTIPPVFSSGVLTIGGESPTLSKFTVSPNNKVELRPDISQANGYLCAVIVGREPKGTLDPESKLVASYNPWSIWTGGTTGALSCTIGTASGNKMVAAAPAAQFAGVKVGNRNDVLTDELDFICAKSAAIGNDELTLDF